MQRARKRALVLPGALALGLLGATAPRAQDLCSTAETRQDVGLTIYNEDLSLVRERRTIPTRSGVFRLRFEDVTSGIDPATVHLQPVGKEALHIVEQNYEFDLISRDKLMEKYVGRDVSYRTEDGTIGQARLLSVNQGYVYQLGEKVVFELPGTIVLDAVPEELAARPTLVWELDGARSGERQVEVTYLSRGLSWRADYVLLLEENEKQAALTGWVTIDNRSGGSFAAAQLKLVAGDVRRVRPVIERARMMAMEGKLAELAFAEEAFFEYHLYTLQRRADLKDNQQKQILFFDADPVQISKSYRFRGGVQHLEPRTIAPAGTEHVEVSLGFENTRANGLGVPVPQGVLRVYKRDKDGAAQFLGEDRVQHTPKDEKLEFTVGNAFDVVGKRVQTDFKRLAEDAFEAGISVELTNHKTEAIEVAVEEVFQGDWTILESSRPFKKKDAMTAVFAVPVKPDEKTTLTYRVRVQP